MLDARQAMSVGNAQSTVSYVSEIPAFRVILKVALCA
jgi:hypothetical protein